MCRALPQFELFAMPATQIHSTVDFDYTAYTAENLRRFEAAFATYQTMDRA